jgi:hypothetical protein
VGHGVDGSGQAIQDRATSSAVSRLDDHAQSGSGPAVARLPQRRRAIARHEPHQLRVELAGVNRTRSGTGLPLKDSGRVVVGELLGEGEAHARVAALLKAVRSVPLGIHRASAVTAELAEVSNVVAVPEVPRAIEVEDQAHLAAPRVLLREAPARRAGPAPRRR